MKKRFLSMLLAVAMALTIVPSTAIAMAVEPETSPAQGGLDAGGADYESFEFITSAPGDYYEASLFGVTQKNEYPKDGKYFGNQLVGDAKTIYAALETFFANTENQTTNKVTFTTQLAQAPTDGSVEVADALAAFDRDHSEVFWTKMGSIYPNQSVKIEFATSDTWGTGGNRTISDDQSRVESVATQLANGAKAASQNSRYAQLKYVHDWLVNNNQYGKANDSSLHYQWEAIGALDTTIDPVCEAYSRAFKLVCDKLGIPCILVSGTGDGGDHMWNYVQMEDNNWYLVDVTWDDPVTDDGSEILRYVYFLVGSESQGSHEVNTNFISVGEKYNSQFLYPTLSTKNYEDPNAPTSITVTVDSSTSIQSGENGKYVMVPQAREHGADNAVEIGLTANASGGNSSTYVFDWSVTGASNMDGITIMPNATDSSKATLTITNKALKDVVVQSDQIKGYTLTITATCSTMKSSTDLGVCKEALKPTFLEVRNPDNQVVGPNGTTAYNIESGKTMTFTAKVLDQYGTEMADQAEMVKWTVNESNAKGSVNNGAVTANTDAKNGDEFSVTVSVENSTIQEQLIAFTVKAPATPLTEVALEYTAPADLTYDGQPKTPTIALHDGNSSLVKDTDYTVTYKRANGISNDTTNAGTITVEIKGIGNYTGTLTRTYTIEKFQPTITPDPKTISDLYVGGTATFTVTATGHTTGTNLLNDLQVTSSSTGVATVTYNNGTATVTAVKDGTATITVSYPGNTNYKAASATVTVKVNARPPVATVSINGLDNGKAVFGDELTADVTNLQPGESEDTFNYAWYRDDGTTAIGTAKTYEVKADDIGHKLTVKVTGTNTNYDPAASAEVEAVAVEVTVNVTLTPASVEVGGTAGANVTVTPTNGKNKGIDLTSPAVTYKSSDTSVATVDTSGNVTALKAGTTDITAAYAADGYKTAEGSAPLTVTKKSLEGYTFTITLNQDSFTYTGSEQKAAVTSVAAAPAAGGGDSVTLAATDYTVSYEGDSTNVGTVTVSVTSAETGSYTWTTAKTKTYTITQATFNSEEITVPIKNVAGSTAAKDLTGLYPAAQPDASTVTYTVTGGTNVDSTVESGILTLTTKGSPGAGTEESITVTTATKNYSTATFTIKVQYTDKTPVTLTAIPATDLVYDGTAKTAAASGVPEGVTLEYAYSGVGETTYGPSAEAPTNVGTYSVTVKIPDGNEDYVGSDTVSFAITPKPITVKAKTISVNVGDPMPKLYEVEGLAGSDTFIPDVTGAPESTDTEGEFPFTVSGPATSTDGNYSITYEPASGTLTVTKQTAATPTATPESRTFTDSVEVTLECTTPGAKIYYVTDTAKDPAIDGIEFTAPITLTETTTIKAIAKAENMNNSDPLEVTYTKQTPQPPVVDPEPQPPVPVQTATPVITPAGGVFYGTQQVAITCATPDASIYYSVDGSAYSLYNGAFVLYNSATVKAYATAPGMTASNETSASFTRYTPAPAPDPDPEPDDTYEPPVSSSKPGTSTQPAQPTIPTQPTTPTVPEVTARPEATVDGGTASAAVPAETVEKLVEQAVTGSSSTVVIAPVIGGDVTKTEVKLPASAVRTIASQTNAELKVATPVADVTISNDSLAGLGNQGAEIAVTAEKSEDGGVDVAVVVDGQRMENVPIKAAIPTPCGPGTVAKIVDANGNVISTVRKSSASGDGQTMNVPLDGSAKVVFVDGGKSFPDVPETNWAADAVAFASSHELMNGVSESSFSPSAPMTRGMLAVVLHNLEGNPGASYKGGFSDVTGSAWYAGAVQWASEKKVVTGLSDGVFAPDSPITREQLVVMLYRYMGEPAVSGSSLGRFSDSGNVSGWAAQAMSWAVANGVVNGSNGALNPQGSATRAEVAQMLMNFVSSGML